MIIGDLAHTGELHSISNGVITCRTSIQKGKIASTDQLFLGANRLPLSSPVESIHLAKPGICCLLQLDIFQSGLF
jgi:hypothetical protein